MGHFVMGPARRQNAAMGSFANIGSMWMNSPAHRAALLDPDDPLDGDRRPGRILDVQRLLNSRSRPFVVVVIKHTPVDEFLDDLAHDARPRRNPGQIRATGRSSGHPPSQEQSVADAGEDRLLQVSVPSPIRSNPRARGRDRRFREPD